MGREWHRSSGCMSGMLHFIDFHRLLFTDWRTAAAHDSSPQQHTALTNLKGLEEENAVMKENHCEVPSRIRIHQVRVALEKKREKMEYFLEEERRSSQVDTPRSPGIVARLMGLELLPEPPVFYSVNSSSPTLKNTPHDYSQKKKKQHHPRKPLQIKNTNTMNCSPPPSPLSQKSKPRIRASSRHRDENENENDLKRVKQCYINNRNREAKKQRRALCSRTEEQEDEFQYVRSVLLHAFQFKYFSHSHLINPAIFHLLELQLKFPTSSQLQHRWNRKLLFHLVGEIVGDLIHYQGFSNNMLGRVWREIRNYPLADCRVIADIDALVAGDLLQANVRQLLHHPAVAEEAAQVVAEVEKDILDELVKEMFTKIYV